MRVFETDAVVEYLQTHQLLQRYKKVKKNFEAGRYHQIKFKKRQPFENEEWQFRITLKYRAFGYFKEDGFLVVKISDHQ